MSVEAVSDRPSAYGRRVNPILTADFHRGRRPANAGKRYPPEIYTDDEVLGMMARCGRGPGGFRNRAMIAVMWRSGLRVAEVCALEPRDIDFTLGAITVRHGKGDKHRVVHMDPPTAALLTLWMQRRERLRVSRGRPLFCTYERGRAGLPLRTAYIRDALKRAADRAGVEKRMHPHGLRHTFAFNLLLAGVDVMTISQALGHRDLATTYRYLNHICPLERIRLLQQLPWPDASAFGTLLNPLAAEQRTTPVSAAAAYADASAATSTPLRGWSGSARAGAPLPLPAGL